MDLRLNRKPNLPFRLLKPVMASMESIGMETLSDFYRFGWIIKVMRETFDVLSERSMLW